MTADATARTSPEVALGRPSWQDDPARYADARDAVGIACADLHRLHPPGRAGRLGEIETWQVVAQTARDLLAETIRAAVEDPWPFDPAAWPDIADALGLTVDQARTLYQAHIDPPETP